MWRLKINVHLQIIWVQEQFLLWACWETASLTALCKIVETCPSASHAKQLLEGMLQNRKITWSALCLKLLCNISTRILNSSVRRLFSEKIAVANWIMHSAICQVYSQSSHIVILSKTINVSCFEWHFLIEWCLHYTKNVIIRISKCW